MVSGDTRVMSLGAVLSALAGIKTNSLPASMADLSATARVTSPALGLRRVADPPPSSQRVEVPASITHQISELERVNNIGALRSVAVTAFNTLNSSIKRVHQGQ